MQKFIRMKRQQHELAHAAVLFINPGRGFKDRADRRQGMILREKAGRDRLTCPDNTGYDGSGNTGL